MSMKFLNYTSSRSLVSVQMHVTVSWLLEAMRCGYETDTTWLTFELSSSWIGVNMISYWEDLNDFLTLEMDLINMIIPAYRQSVPHLKLRSISWGSLQVHKNEQLHRSRRLQRQVLERLWIHFPVPSTQARGIKMINKETKIPYCHNRDILHFLFLPSSRHDVYVYQKCIGTERRKESTANEMEYLCHEWTWKNTCWRWRGERWTRNAL